MSSVAICIAKSMGIAKPMPAEEPDVVWMSVLIPMMRPPASVSAPPELPG
jgi:hypothetical protein